MANNEIHSQEWVDKIEGLARQSESISDPKARSVTVDLLRAVLDFHAAGLERVLDIIFEAGPAGEAIIRRILDEDVSSSMLLLHDLHPDDLETRVSRALRTLQGMFSSLGAKLSLLAIDARTVRLHFESQHTWPGTPVRSSIEKAILQAAPEISSVIIEGLQETRTAGFVPVSELLASSPA